MILKIIKAVWFLSLMGFMAIFMYIYASLPQQVVIQEGVERLSLSRDSVFYITLGVVALINVLVFVFSKLYGNRNEPFSVWFFVQIILLNFFLITVLGYFNVLNSGERFSYDNLGIVIYGSVALVIIWAIGWPLYSVSRKIVDKQTV
ncbi:MAG TPA: hypothetical protein PK185_10900 [Cyclobacteriaceae bacterium]|nr:hypothetical protein [Cyclobacteriaceae bacterium]